MLDYYHHTCRKKLKKKCQTVLSIILMVNIYSVQLQDALKNVSTRRKFKCLLSIKKQSIGTEFAERAKSYVLAIFFSVFLSSPGSSVGRALGF